MKNDNERSSFFDNDDEGEESLSEHPEASEPSEAKQTQTFPAKWPMPVDGADLLDQTHSEVNATVIMGDYASVACALWVPHTSVSSYFPRHRAFLFIPPRTAAAKPRLWTFLKSWFIDLLPQVMLHPLTQSLETEENTTDI